MQEAKVSRERGTIGWLEVELENRRTAYDPITALPLSCLSDAASAVSDVMPSCRPIVCRQESKSLGYPLPGFCVSSRTREPGKGHEFSHEDRQSNRWLERQQQRFDRRHGPVPGRVCPAEVTAAELRPLVSAAFCPTSPDTINRPSVTN